MIINPSRMRPEDRGPWLIAERGDKAAARLLPLDALADRSLDAIEAFARSGSCYAGVSWGKDSTVLAHLVWRLGVERDVVIPLVHVVVQPIRNPDCPAVRDAFLAAHPHAYEEHVAWCSRDSDGWHATGTLEAGFARAVASYGDRHVSGVRGEESGQRALRMRRWGTTTENTCAPLGWWTARHVFAYLAAHNLPVHPAYACTLGGRLDRERIRVSSLGGERGRTMGRLEWERIYYSDALGHIAGGRT